MRFGKGSAWSLFGLAAPQVLSLFAYVVVARLLERQVFGELGIIQNTVATSALVAGAGLSITATKHVSELRIQSPERTGRIVGLCFLVTTFSGTLAMAVLYLFGPLLARLVLNSPSLAPELRMSSVLIVINTLNGTQVGTLLGFESYRLNAQLALLRGVILCTLLIIGARQGELSGVLLGLIMAGAVGCAVNHIAIVNECHKRGVSIRHRGCWSERRLLWMFSLPAFLSTALITSVILLGGALLVRQPNGYAEMGLFHAANQWRLAVGFLPAILGQTALPILSSLHGSGDLARYRSLMMTNLGLTIAGASCAALPIMLLSPLIMASYGPAFSAGWLVLVVLAASAILSGCSQAVGHVLTSSGQMWRGMAFNCGWVLVFIAVAPGAVTRWGALGLAAAYLTSYAIHGIAMLSYAVFVIHGNSQSYLQRYKCALIYIVKNRHSDKLQQHS